MNIVTEVRRITVVLTCALLMLSACQSGSPNSASVPPSAGMSGNATVTVVPTQNAEEAEIKAGIQKTLDDYNAGLEKNDKTLFTTTRKNQLPGNQ